MKGMLNSLNLNCLIVENGKEAYDYVTSHYDEIDVILMDCEMPVMDGYEATRAIRKWEGQQNMSSMLIIAVTAHVITEMVDDSINAGMDGHLSKPINKQKLIEMLVTHTSH